MHNTDSLVYKLDIAITYGQDVTFLWLRIGWFRCFGCVCCPLTLCLSVCPSVDLSVWYLFKCYTKWLWNWMIDFIIFFFLVGGGGRMTHPYTNIYKLTTLDGDLTTFCIWDKETQQKKKKQRTNNQQKNIQKTQERESTKLFGNLIFLLITNNYHYYYLLHQFIYLSSVRIVEERHITHTHHTYNHPSFFFQHNCCFKSFFFFGVIQISPKFAEVFVR